MCPVPKLTYATLDVVSVLGIFARETRKKTSFATPHQCSRFPGPRFGLGTRMVHSPRPREWNPPGPVGSITWMIFHWISILYIYIYICFKWYSCDSCVHIHKYYTYFKAMKTSRIIAYPCCVPYVAEGEQRMIFKSTRPVANSCHSSIWDNLSEWL